LAVTGWSTSNFLRYAGSLAAGPPITMACRAMLPSIGYGPSLIGLFSSAATQTFRRQYSIGIGNTGLPYALLGTDGGFAVTNGGGSVTAGVWSHICGRFTSAPEQAIFLDGGAKVTSSISGTPTSVDRFSVGVIDSAALQNNALNTAQIAEAAIWGAALSDADIASLATGVSPLLVHPESLIGYWPLIGEVFPSRNLLSNVSVLGLQGSLSAAPHPRVLL